MTVKTAEPYMADEIMEIIEDGRAYLKSQGLDQWQEGYPDRAQIDADLASGNGRVFCVGDRIAGYACVCFGADPFYFDIDGAWLDDKPYAVIHRCAVKASERGKGLGDTIFKTLEGFVKERGFDEIRVDTHRGNMVMQHLLQKNGYVYCGIILFDGRERLAFQKNL